VFYIGWGYKTEHRLTHEIANRAHRYDASPLMGAHTPNQEHLFLDTKADCNANIFTGLISYAFPLALG